MKNGAPTEAGTMKGRILLMLSLAVATTAVSPTQEELSYEEAISSVIDLYNQEPGVARAFRLLEAKPQPEWDPSMESLQELEFTVRETTCPSSTELDLDECDFKDGGVVKECHGTIFSEQGAPIVQYVCETAGETAGEGHIRVRRTFTNLLEILKMKKLKKIFFGRGPRITQGPGPRITQGPGPRITQGPGPRITQGPGPSTPPTSND